MNTAMSKEELEKILDQAVQDVTECTAGVRLHQENQSPGEDLCTVQITFDRGFRTSLTLCADRELLFKATQVPAHFAPPVFYHGRYEPEGQEIQFMLTYSDEYSKGAQFIHHVPCSGPNENISDED